MNARTSKIVLASLAASAAMLASSSAQATAMQAITVPWVPTNTNLPHLTYSGKAVTLKGIARGGTPTQYMWDYGDGSTPMSWTNVPGSGNYNLGVTHTYTGNVGQLYIATLSVTDGTNVATAIYPIEIQQCSSVTTSDPNQMDVCVAVAEDEGLWNIHVNMTRSTYAAGSPGYGQSYGYWGSDIAGTCASMDALELHGSKPQSNYDADPYVEDTQRAMNYVLNQFTSVAISSSGQIGPDGGANNPDVNQDGIGLYANVSEPIYIGGICATAFSSSGAPGLVAQTGNSYIYGQTYKHIAQDMVDWFAWGQNDGTGSTAGGWLYTANSGSADGSTNQWPIIAMSAAENNMGATIPAFVRAQIPYFLNTIHNTTAGTTYGAYGYQSASQYPNVAKTAGGILANFFLGNSNTYPDVQKGLGFIYTNWSTYSGDWTSYNLGNSYAMYDVMKSMSAANPRITRIYAWDQTNNVQSTTNSFDWYYTPAGQTQTGLATQIVQRQTSAGGWTDNNPGDNGLSSTLVTAWDTLILLRAVTSVPPHAAICNCSAQWSVNSPITMDGSCSIEPDQTKAIVAYKWDFAYNGTTFNQSCFSADGTTIESCDAGNAGFPVQGVTATKPDGFSQYTESADGGPPVAADGGLLTPAPTFPVALEVIDDTPASQGGAQSSVTSCNVIIKPPPHCPQANAGGPYLASINKPVQLSAAGSTQVDGDPLTYVWDFTNENNFSDGGSSTLVNPTITYDAGGTYPIEVQVTNHPPLTDAGVTPGCSVVGYTTVQVGAHAPISVPGGPYTGVPGEVVQLDGSGSSDPDGDSINYAWDLTGAGTYTDSTIVNPTFTVAANATVGTAYSVCLKVTDPTENLSGLACTTVTVIAQHAAPTCVAATTNVQSCTGGNLAVTVDGSHSYDSQGDSFTYSWAMSDGGPGLDNPSSSMPKATFATAGEGCTAGATATLTVSNKYGSASCSQTISIVDNLTPSFSYTPTSTTIECNANTAANINTWLSQVAASEACAAAANPVTLGNNFSGTGGGCGGVGASGTNNSVLVTWTATDPCNSKTAQTQATLTIADTTPPVLSLPSNMTVEATKPQGAVVTYTATANDAATGATAVTCTPASGSTFALGATTVSCSSHDTQNNIASGTFTVTVQDTTPPTLSLPSNMTVEATKPQGAVVTFTASATDLVDTTDSVTCTPASGSTFALGATTVNCSSTDAHNNTATGHFTVTVQDTTPPVVTVPSNMTVEATKPGGAVVTFTSTATDLVDTTDSVTCTPASGSTFALGTSTVSCSATDAHNNTGTKTFTVTVQDTTAPTLSLPSNMTVEATKPQGAVVTYTATATDLVDTTDNVTCTPASGSTFALGTTTVNCSSTDAHNNTATGHFTVTVRDTTPPTLSLPSNMTVEATKPQGAVVTYTATATDLVDTTDSVACTPASGSTFALGATTVNCSSTDAHNNTATGHFTVTVQNTTPPTLSLPSNMTVEATKPQGAVVTYTATANDAATGATAVTCTPASGSTFALGMTTVSCSSHDTQNNIASGTFTVTVRDTTPPTLSLPSNMTVEATKPQGAVVTFTASATDIVDVTDSVSCTPASGSTFALGTTTVNCSSTDAHNNTATGHFTVTVQDTTPPTLTVSQNQVLEATGPNGAVATYTASSTDLVDVTDPVTCTPASGSTFALGTSTVSCSATDAHNNTGTKTFTVTVRDTTPPSFTGVPDGINLTYEATSAAGAVVSTYSFQNNTLAATDLVDVTDPVICSPVAGSTFPLGSTTVSCSSTDAHGNRSNLAFNIVVVDTTPPQITCPSDITVAANGPLGAFNLNMDEPTTDALAAFLSGATAVDLVDPLPTLTNNAPWIFAVEQTTTVTFTSTDAHQNTSTCTANVTVTSEPVTPPALVCPASVTVASGDGQEVDWTAVFRHPVEVSLVVMSGANSGHPLNVSELGAGSVQLASNRSSSGSYAVRLRAVDQINGEAIDCNSFVTVTAGPLLMPADKRTHAKRTVIPAASIRN